jgi:hypothetical protein
LDDFTKVKKRAGKRIKEVRALLKKRDALFRSNRSDVNAVKLGALIRQQLVELMAFAEDLQSMYLAEQKKVLSFMWLSCLLNLFFFLLV